MPSVNVDDGLWKELLRIKKLHTHAKSAKKIGNAEEAKSFEAKADELAAKWFRRLKN